MATVAPPADPLPETRLRASAVLTWPRLRPSAAQVADSIWENSHLYDGLASGSIYFLSRDPAVASTLSPYGYVYDNPINSSDPTGLGINLPGGLCLKNPFDSNDHSCETVAQSFYKATAPARGQDYRVMEFGVGPFAISVTHTRDGSLFLGAGGQVSPPFIPVSAGVRDGQIRSFTCSSWRASDTDIDNFISGVGGTASGSMGRSGGVSLSQIGNTSYFSTEKGWGSPNASAAGQYFVPLP